MVQQREIIYRFNRVAAAAVLLTAMALTSGCSHPAPHASAPTAATMPAPGTPSDSHVSPTLPEDPVIEKQNNEKGAGAPP